MTDPAGKILIIDDEAINLKLLGNLLSKEYSISIVNNGREGLELARSIRPDLILLDVIMPEMDGYEVCERLKKDPNTSGIPVIFITLAGEASQETKGFQTGAVDYIVKPFSTEAVRARVRTHLELKEYRETLEKRVAERTAALKEANTALKVLAQRINDESEALEENMLLNVRERVRPKIKRMMETPLTESQRKLLESIESGLNDLMSPFIGRLKSDSSFFDLSHTELQVADYIQQGKRTKEIADLMNLSTRTIETHRNSLRKKFEIKNRRISLRSHLMSLKKL